MIRVILPFSRPENAEELVRLLEPERIQLYPICDKSAWTIKRDWIHPIIVDDAPHDWFICAYKMNHAIEHVPYGDNDHILFLTDDSCFEPGFFDKLREVDYPIVVCSMKRGDHIAPTGLPHETSTLVASMENLRPGCLGIEQIIWRGDMLRNIRYKNTGMFDGEMGSYIRANYPNLIHFEPEWYAWFNYLQPGRWDK